MRRRKKFKPVNLAREIKRGRKANPLLGDLLLIGLSAAGGVAAYWAWLKYGPSATPPAPEPSGSATVTNNTTGETTTVLPTTTVVGTTGPAGPGLGAFQAVQSHLVAPKLGPSLSPGGIQSGGGLNTGTQNQAPNAPGTLRAGQTLFAGQSISSPDGQFHLDMQADGNLVVYMGAGTGFAVWNSGTQGSGAVGATMQADGNFVLYAPANRAVWATGTVTNNATGVMTMTDGGIITLSNNQNKNYWSSWLQDPSINSTPTGPATYN
jgi:hypothetical protein